MDARRLARGLGWFSIGLGVAELIAPRTIGRVVGSRNHSSLIRAFGLRELAAGVGILATSNPAPWLWSRAAGDMLDLAALGGVLGSPRNSRGKAALNIASVAGVTALDVVCAQRLTGKIRGPRAEASLIVNRSPEECYGFWRNFENLPRFMSYLQSVRTAGDRRSHWIANIGGATIEWDAEIEADVPNQRITWHSLPGADIENSGSVEFERAPGERGTIVRVQVEYGNLAHARGSGGRVRAGAASGADHPQGTVPFQAGLGDRRSDHHGRSAGRARKRHHVAG